MGDDLAPGLDPLADLVAYWLTLIRASPTTSLLPLETIDVQPSPWVLATCDQARDRRVPANLAGIGRGPARVDAHVAADGLAR